MTDILGLNAKQTIGVIALILIVPWAGRQVGLLK